jgi:hypothetical protein
LKDEESDRTTRTEDASREPRETADKKKVERGDDVVRLQWRDWIALTMASLETILLPAVALIAVLVIMILAFRYLG